MRYRVWVLVGLCFLLSAAWVAAQDGQAVSSAACAPALETLWTKASDACMSGPAGFFCNGGSAPQVEPDGAVKQALAPVGALVDVKSINVIHTQAVVSESGVAGLAWLRLTPPVQLTALLVGDVSLRNAAPPDFPAWQSMVAQTGPEISSCGATPHNALLLQTPLGQSANIAVNGVSLGLNGTLLVKTTADQTIFAGLSGESTVYAAGQDKTLRPGQQILVPYTPGAFETPAGAPGEPALLDEALAQNLPVALLDRPIIIPQPGYVMTDGAVNLRVSPSKDAAVLLQVPPGQVLSVLGRNPAGDWLHVRLETGETGWMFAQLLIQNVGPIQAVYEATPLPPQRYGQMGKMAKIVAPAGVNLRSAPDVGFGVVASLADGTQVILLARSPYRPWVKVQYGDNLTGWLALVTLQTQAVIEALPVDTSVPPPPPPTRVPGSFGNAFPDPNNKGG
jgi:uncharacterized protein YgiM (DUF1202 family)